MSFCIIARDQNKEVQEVYAPNEKPSILFRSVVEAFNDSTKDGKENALKVWARAYTPSFKKKFGNWELLSEAKKHIENVKGVYKDLIKDKTQQILFEVAIQANSSTSEKSGAIATFGKELVKIAQQLYPNAKVGDQYAPIVSVPVDMNGEPLVHSVLNEKEKNQTFEKVQDEVMHNPISVLEKIAKESQWEGNRAMAEQFMSYNYGKMGISFEDTIKEFGGWYHSNDRVVINRAKIKERYKDDGNTAEYIEEMVILHEFAHALTMYSIQNNKRYRAKMQELFDLSYPHVAHLYDGEHSLEEFVAEALSNEQFQKALKQIPHEGKLKNVWNAFIDMVRRMAQFYGFPVKGTVLDTLLDETFTEIARVQKRHGGTLGVGGNKISNKAATPQEPQTWGSKNTIDFFEKQQTSINLVENETESYYTNGTIDPITNTLKKYTRLTEYTHEHFYSTDRMDFDSWLNKKTSQEFANRGAALTDKISYGSSVEPLTYDEVKAVIKQNFEESRYKGKIMHKMIEGYLKHGNSLHFADELQQLRTDGGIAEHELLWFGDKEIQIMLQKIGMNTAEFGNTDIKFRDNIASELMMISEELNVGTSNDGFIEHSDGTISFVDYKTGGKFLADEHTVRKMAYANGLSSPVYDSKLDRARLELVTRMIIAKMNKPDLKVRDLKIAYISKYYGTQIRSINVQQFLDYIHNNKKVAIQEHEKEIKKLKASGQPTDQAQAKLEQARKEYRAMKDAGVFDFHNYRGQNKIFEQTDEFEGITDPQEKIKRLKDKVAREARFSLIKENANAVDRGALKKVKDALYAVLNAHKASNAPDVQTDTKDISWFASKVMGLREQANAFLQSISQMFEEATDRSVKRVNELVGEQSEFRKADRALYKEYNEKHRGITTTALTFSYSQGNVPVPASQQGIFDFMYTWKNVAGENVRVGAVYTEQDVKDGKITQVQYDYYKASKKVLKEVYEAVRNKVAYVREDGKAVTYGEEYKKSPDGFKFEAFQDSFLPTIPFQNAEEIIEKNIQTKQLNPLKITKEWFENYKDAYDLAIQNENKFNIGMPLKYMSQDHLQNDDHSFNVSLAVDIFTRHMVNKFELDDVYDVGMTTIAAMSDTSDPDMKDAKGRLHLENSVFLLQSFLNQNILGQRRNTLNYWGKKNVVANKRTDMVLDNIGGFISKNAFWFAPVTATFNGLYGLITNSREGLIGSLSKRFFDDDNAISLSHILQATRISGAHQVKNIYSQGNIKRQFFEDFEGTYYKDKVNFMMKMFRLSNKNYNYADQSLAMGMHNRILAGDNAYAMQGLGEDLSNETLMIAALLAQKVTVKTIDANGQELVKYYKKDGTLTTDKNDPKIQNMWDAYEMNDQTGEFEYKGPTRFIDANGQAVKGLTTLETVRAKTFLERMYGAYSPEQKVHLERYGLGRMAMKFRKFWIANIRENFTMSGHNRYVGEYQMLFDTDANGNKVPRLKDGQPMYEWKTEEVRARLTVLVSLLGSFAGVTGSKSWNDMNSEDKKQFVRMMFQLAMLGFVIAIGMGAVIPPEDEDKLYAKRIKRLAEDLSAIHPLDLIRGTTTIDSYPTQLFKAANATFQFFNSVATDDIVESGPYKGDYKGWNTVEDFIPIYHANNQAAKLLAGE